jgi:DNA-directed RNA polymerase subunit F
MTLRIDVETYETYRERVMELANEVTRVEDGEYVAELRSSEEIAAEIDGLTPAEVADIRTIAEVEGTPIEDFHTADEKL